MPKNNNIINTNRSMSEFTTYKPFEDEIDAEELIQLLQK